MRWFFKMRPTFFYRVINNIKVKVWNWIVVKESKLLKFSVEEWLGDPWCCLSDVVFILV